MHFCKFFLTSQHVAKNEESKGKRKTLDCMFQNVMFSCFLMILLCITLGLIQFYTLAFVAAKDLNIRKKYWIAHPHSIHFFSCAIGTDHFHYMKNECSIQTHLHWRSLLENIFFTIALAQNKITTWITFVNILTVQCA